MPQPKHTFDFTQRFVEKMLINYGEKVKTSPLFSKIPYDAWTKMRKAEHGIKIEVFDDYLHLYTTDSHGLEDDFIGSFSKNHHFGKFLYEEYLNKSISEIEGQKEDYNKISFKNGEYLSVNQPNYNTHSNGYEYGNYTCSNTAITPTTYLNKVYSLSDSITDVINEIVDNKEKEKEKDKMKGFNFDFGPCTNDNVKMSVYGLAIQNAAGEWVSYDTKSGQIMNVDLLNFDGRRFMFKLPVAIKDIAKGDIVIHNKVPMFVLSIEDGGVIAVDVRAGEEKKILPTNSPFGFNFVTKVVSMFNAFNGAPTPDAPFGNFLPFMMMGDGNEIDPFVMCMMMQNMGNAQCGNMFSNPMMMYFLMKDGGASKDFMLPMLMMQTMNQSTSGVIKSNK